MYEFGTRIIGFAQPVTEDLRLEIGKVFQINVQASQGIIDPEGVANFLLSKLNEEYPEIKVTWMKICEKYQTIDFQFATVQTLGLEPRTSRLFISTLLVWLPLILTLIGITAVGISAWSILAQIPWYIWAILGTGVVLLIFGSSIARAVTRGAPEKYRPTFVVR